MKLGEKISAKRKSKGFSQELLAENSGISLRTIQRIENSQSNPRPYTMKVIADALNIKSEDLFDDQNTGSGPLPNHSSESKINLVNSSALLGIFLPLLNIVAPVVFWGLNRTDPMVNIKGKKVIGFQILWSLVASLVLLATHFLHYKIAGELVSGRIPIVAVVYFLLLLPNVFLIIRTSIQLNNGKTEIYPFIPDLF